MTSEDKLILRRLLHRTWDYIGDDVYGTSSRNQVWELSVDRASPNDDEERRVFNLYLKESPTMSIAAKDNLKKEIFAYRWYEGGRP
jgi:hypothetical protein